METKENRLYKLAYQLSLFTIFYNIIEGIVSMSLGYADETLSLFGFGADSFIEVMSGIGIAIMILRIKQNPDSPKSKFEITALKITGTAFYLLSVGLFAGIVLNLINHHKPETTLWGVIISLVSIVVMVWLMNAKKSVGKKLQSEPIIADANCTKVCVYMSLVLLVSSLVYELTGFAYADVIGAAGLMYFSISEGKEAFEKVKGKEAFEKVKGKECSCETK
ncbi:MAG: cation transporter [Bacteroidales bacterium]|jgi:divalent metal cation (Fe/Co/Zn/Cd) transporter